MPRSRPNIVRVSRPVIKSIRGSTCGQKPIFLRAAATPPGTTPVTSCPATKASPAVGVTSPVNTPKVVVFPAPFTPSKPYVSPLVIAVVTPRTALLGKKDVSFSSSSLLFLLSGWPCRKHAQEQMYTIHFLIDVTRLPKLPTDGGYTFQRLTKSTEAELRRVSLFCITCARSSTTSSSSSLVLSRPSFRVSSVPVLRTPCQRSCSPSHALRTRRSIRPNTPPAPPSCAYSNNNNHTKYGTLNPYKRARFRPATSQSKGRLSPKRISRSQ
mmetsp:Transcript_7767/g.17901  ORF Transcript_7767/g.17901 Transcript_7767/m.17901 type:complete len:269 (+) Transcript_7767:1071-1877(+)